MIGKLPDRTQKDFFQPLLSEFINLEHELVLFAEKINWKELENEFSPLYSSTGTPSKPIRLICGRAAIEPTISHMKHQYRMIKNYLKGSFGDRINAMMATYNFKKWMNKIRMKFLRPFYFLLFQIGRAHV